MACSKKPENQCLPAVVQPGTAGPGCLQVAPTRRPAPVLPAWLLLHTSPGPPRAHSLPLAGCLRIPAPPAVDGDCHRAGRKIGDGCQGSCWVGHWGLGRWERGLGLPNGSQLVGEGGWGRRGSGHRGAGGAGAAAGTAGPGPSHPEEAGAACRGAAPAEACPEAAGQGVHGWPAASILVIAGALPMMQGHMAQLQHHFYLVMSSLSPLPALGVQLLNRPTCNLKTAEAATCMYQCEA